LRQIDDEATASTEALALGDDRATVQTDQSAHEGEAQTEPRRCQGAGRALGLRETFEDALELINLDAGALVGHFEPHLGVALRCRYADEAAFARELGRIDQQVRQHLAQPHHVDRNPQFVRHLDAESLAFRTRLGRAEETRSANTSTFSEGRRRCRILPTLTKLSAFGLDSFVVSSRRPVL